MDQRKVEQEAIRRQKAKERREKMYNFGKGNTNVKAAEVEMTEES